MFCVFVLLHLFWWNLMGVFGVEIPVKVTEGDSITLHSDFTKRHGDVDILWNFGAEKSLIAKISFEKQVISTYDGPDRRFRDRLKLDNKTGSLTITNIRAEDTGLYEVEISASTLTTKTFIVYVYARLPVPVISRNSSQCSSSSCSVVCSVANVSHVTLSWLKGNSLLSSISVSDLSISLSLPLEVEDQDTNNYSCVLNNSITHQTTHLDISGVCQTCEDQGLPVFHIVLISAAGSLLIVAAVVIFCICNKCRKTVQTQEEDRAHSALCKPTPRKKKSKEPIYENVSEK